ncbi:MAG: chromate efflux transporter [Actinobacteria bacterium]|nr:chromate efflux transporter [Actinomycetota bacterium]
MATRRPRRWTGSPPWRPATRRRSLGSRTSSTCSPACPTAWRGRTTRSGPTSSPAPRHPAPARSVCPRRPRRPEVAEDAGRPAGRAQEQGRLGELVRLFGKLGLIAFGGPAAHIAMTHDEVVTRRRWMDDQHFVDLMGLTNLIPGPNSTEMTMHVGHHRAGWRGLVVAGASFILPAALIVGTLAWAYVEYGDTPSGEALMYGIKPVVIAIILQALVKLGRTALVGVVPAHVALAVGILYLFGLNEILLLAAGAALVFAVRSGRRLWDGGGSAGLVGVLAPGLTLVAQDGTASLGVGRLFLVFLKVGAVLYGSGYVLLAFLRNDLVVNLEVLTNAQLLDAIAIGQFTPGPVFTTATFIGYVLAGIPGAVVATIGIFLPAFLFVGLLTRIIPKVRDREWTADLLDGVNAAALGLMGGVLIQLGGDAVVDPLTGVLAVAAALALWRFELNSAWLVLTGAAVGLVASAIGP